ncbi:peptidoglycan DD-metalloendopeptidase family protein [Shewanella surugensis]|uniref:Peptidoglycan DD-metalloendopeptidase family protein n=1 Tax=Shewanella surugensis TaxID=212020 RepID=A0ABT0L6Z5_9GAMM|nr:peptidoglycan DD-metalloendopeptidase family protein [Shewanella surugensis]MCL1123132.1 peptidoglycan DD-metalloendopeptidase family protein [Shewanella surugensis]
MGKIITLFNLLPKFHQIALSVLICTLLFVVLIFPHGEKTTQRSALNNGEYALNTRYTVDINGTKKPAQSASLVHSTSKKRQQENASVNSHSLIQAKHDLSPIKLTTVEAQYQTEEFTVKKGDTLASLFKRAGLSSKDVYDITLLPNVKTNLLKILPGEEIIIAKDQAGMLVQLHYPLDPIRTLIINKNKDHYIEKITSKKVKYNQKFASAIIKTNFWNAGISASLTPNQIMQLATLFGWDIDFALDLRKDDSFSILFEKKYADGQFLKNGHILAAEFINQGERYTAIRYTDGHYYSEEGRSMRKDFLRSPVDFKYVSSRFNPRRLHPVTGQVKAHRGVDYVAAIGTPIKAAGKGRVIKSSYNKYNGNYVFIKHNDTYTTKYLHLKKRKVKTGQTVKQGDIIGTLGATGRITGPHLHYEFIVNGVHRNPRTIKLPKSKPIASQEKAQFLSLSQRVMATLEQNKQVQLAYRD